jgi:hypothetical protein
MRNPLAEELFKTIETTQGFAYISDGITGSNMSDEEIINLAAKTIDWYELAIKILNNFIKMHPIKS